MNNQFFITSALPYTNAPLHLGHILEFIQTDIWIRHINHQGKRCFYFSGIDAHGTPIMLSSLVQNKSPEKLINEFYLSYYRNLNCFNIICDNFYTTNSYENEIFSRNFFLKLYEKKVIFTENVLQFYDLVVNMFLPDRYVIGICPKCKSGNQYGDICNICNFNYSSVDLISPVSKLSKSIPVKKNTKHYFLSFQNNNFHLKNWCYSTLTQNHILNKLKEWLSTGLNDWDLSRNTPYFGIKIPLEYDKFFYVWVDAPLGYFSSAQNFFKKFSINFLDFFIKKKSLDFYHFIGKDIIYFHCLFFPFMLLNLNYKLPTDIWAHGFLTVNGLKMSKSSGTFILANDIVKKIRPDFLRFYFASKLHNGFSDIDFDFNELCIVINSNFIGKFLNIYSRVIKLLKNYYDSILANKIDFLFYEFLNINDLIFENYKNRNYFKVVNIVLEYSDKINIYLDKEKPWNLVKHKTSMLRAHIICTTTLNLFLVLLYYLSPIIPEITNDIQKLLYINFESFVLKKEPLLNVKINNCEYFLSKIKEI